MANDNIAVLRSAGKTTFIYGLVDPRTNQLRYVGKTVLHPERRVITHKWRARAQPQKRHSMAWLLNLEKSGLEPDVFVIEEIEAGGDWVEAEQFWIAYFRMIGADLCNHTSGGEGQTGFKQSAESIAKRVKRGDAHHQFGRPMPAHTREALRIGNESLRSDPLRHARAEANRLAGMTPEAMANSRAALIEFTSNPEKRAAAQIKATEGKRTEKFRLGVSEQSKRQWSTDREKIVAAQNVGKDAEWRRQASLRATAKANDPAHRAKWILNLPRKISAEDLADIKARLARGERVGVLAAEYKVDSSTISHIKSGRRRR